MCAEGLNYSPSLDMPLCGKPPIYIFSSKPPTIYIFFWQYRPNGTRDKHKNKLSRESYFFIFGRLQSNVIGFFISNIFVDNIGVEFNLK